MENQKQVKNGFINGKSCIIQQRAILDNIPDIAWLKDEQSRFIMVNERFGKTCGFKPEDLIGKTDLDIWPADLAQSYRADDQEVMKSKKRKIVEEKLADKEGKVTWIETIKTPIFDDQGKVIGTTGIARDITKRKKDEEKINDIRAELALRVKVRTAELSNLNEELRSEILERKEAELKYRTILDNALDCFYIVDVKNGNLLEANDAYCSTIGYSRDELLKMNLGDVEAIENPEEIKRHIERIIKAGADRFETMHRAKDGKNLNFEISVNYLRDKAIFFVFMRDITARKNAEKALLASEEKFRTVAEFNYDWEYWCDPDNKLVYTSPSCQRISGYSAQDFMNNQDLMKKIVHQDDLDLFLKHKKKVKEERTKLEIDFRIINRDGKIRWISHICVPVYDKEKKFIGRRVSNRDITEKKAYEEELKTYQGKLEILVEQRTKNLESEMEARQAKDEEAKALNKQIEFILGATKTGLDIIDKDYNICYIDSEWAKIYGDWEGKKCFEYFMDRKSPCPVCAIDEVLRTKKIVVTEEVLFKENNRPIQVTTIPFQDEKGEWLVAEVNVDISQKKKIEEELHRYRNHLEQLVEERTQELLQETARCKNSEFEKSKLNRELIKVNEKLKSITLVDPHTGLYNYRYLRDIIEAEFHQARRYAQNLSIIMLDVDYFKSINDVYGISFGDLVLKQLSRELKRMVRRYDILIRYSGEEFIIISPRINLNIVFSMAQRLLEALNFINFGNKKHSVKLKLSFSVVSFPQDRAKNGMDLVNLANKVLSRVKESGGNRVYTLADIKSPLKKGIEKISKVVGVRTLRNRIDKLKKQSKQGLVESIFAFAKTLELKDHYTGEHVENTVHFATEIAKELNLSKDEIELIKQAAMLHDLGKIGISDSILLKKGKLNRKEFAEIKKHPQIGADIIRPIQFLHALIPFIFYHHERWDGKGYPSGIRGEDIPLGARIIAIADVYQALTSDRPYHKAFSKAVSIDIIKKGTGSQFDPRVVNCFLKIISKEKQPRLKLLHK